MGSPTLKISLVSWTIDLWFFDIQNFFIKYLRFWRFKNCSVFLKINSLILHKTIALMPDIVLFEFQVVIFIFSQLFQCGLKQNLVMSNNNDNDGI